jgi:hypothetical protein
LLLVWRWPVLLGWLVLDLQHLGQMATAFWVQARVLALYSHNLRRRGGRWL